MLLIFISLLYSILTQQYPISISNPNYIDICPNSQHILIANDALFQLIDIHSQTSIVGPQKTFKTSINYIKCITNNHILFTTRKNQICIYLITSSNNTKCIKDKKLLSTWEDIDKKQIYLLIEKSPLEMAEIIITNYISFSNPNTIINLSVNLVTASYIKGNQLISIYNQNNQLKIDERQHFKQEYPKFTVKNRLNMSSIKVNHNHKSSSLLLSNQLGSYQFIRQGRISLELNNTAYPFACLYDQSSFIIANNQKAEFHNGDQVKIYQKFNIQELKNIACDIENQAFYLLDNYGKIIQIKIKEQSSTKSILTYGIGGVLVISGIVGAKMKWFSGKQHRTDTQDAQRQDRQNEYHELKQKNKSIGEQK